MTLYIDYFSEARKNPSKIYLSSWYWLILFGLIAFVLPCMIAYSRMILGVHSLDQVIFGFSMGVWLALNMEFVVDRARLMVYVQSLLSS